MTWCEVNTRDAVKARDFYCALYGLTWERAPGEMEYYVLRRGETRLAGVAQMDKSWPAEIPAHWLGYFTVADADVTVKQAVKGGDKVLMGPFDSPFGRIVVLADPFGAAFTVVSRPAA
jgi:predicted enzyme related to lactoylglutathione lyase